MKALNTFIVALLFVVMIGCSTSPTGSDMREKDEPEFKYRVESTVRIYYTNTYDVDDNNMFITFKEDGYTYKVPIYQLQEIRTNR